jgi:hypothetical protein
MSTLSQGFTLLEQGYLSTNDMLSGISPPILRGEETMMETSSVTNTTTVTDYYPILTTETDNDVQLRNALMNGIVGMKQMEQELIEKSIYIKKKCQQQEEIILDLVKCLKDLKEENEMLRSQFQLILQTKQEQANSLSLRGIMQPAIPQPVITTPKEEPNMITTTPSRKRKRFDFRYLLPPSMIKTIEPEKEETPAIQFVNHGCSEIESWILDYQESKTREKRKYRRRKNN